MDTGHRKQKSSILLAITDLMEVFRTDQDCPRTELHLTYFVGNTSMDDFDQVHSDREVILGLQAHVGIVPRCLDTGQIT